MTDKRTRSTAAENWEIVPIDELTGEPLTPEEVAHRERVRSEAARGYVAIDPVYERHRSQIHQPLANEAGAVVDDYWELQRANRTALRIQLEDMSDPDKLQREAINIAQFVLDDFAGQVMELLFSIANAPPYWRRNEFSARISELLDRIGYERDHQRGSHRSANRQRLCRTLLALHFTHVNVERTVDGRTVGFFAPLLAGLGYAIDKDNAAQATQNSLQRFQSGLPEEVYIALHPWWSRGVSDRSALPGRDYVLIPRPFETRPRRPRGGKRSRVADLLRSYIQQCRERSGASSVSIARRVLLDAGGITNSNNSQANTTLARALDRLCAEGQLTSYTRPLPIGMNDLVSLSWAQPSSGPMEPAR